MWSYSLLVLFLILFGGKCSDDEYDYEYDETQAKQIVVTEQGKVEGNLASNKLYYEFLGIPYGTPVRFRAPTDPPKIPDVFKAENRLNFCPQFPSNDPLAYPSVNEDCLTLNIFASHPNSNYTQPVMVFFHGGDFGLGTGSPSFYGPQYLVSQGVLVVTLNYRLNAYGFLNLGLEEAPGNAGLKDMRQALRWIKKNIASFGGDKDNITVFGQGSGGTAAIYLTLSESCKGLFNRIICESGTLFSPNSFDHEPLKTAEHLAKSLDLNTNDPEKLLELYTETPVEKVLEAISKQMNPKSVFLPSVEKQFDGEEAFLLESPFKMLLEKKCSTPVPILIGINTVEGLTSPLDYNTITSQMDRIKNEDFSVLDQRNFRVPKEEKDAFREILIETYFSNITSDEALVGGIINLNSDFLYVGPQDLFTEMYANATGQAIYGYIFNHIGNRNLGRLLTNSSLPVTTNQDELFYIFELERLPLPMDENDARIVTFMTSLWTNFAKFGLPTPNPESGSWLPYPHILAISLEPEYVEHLTPDRSAFWRSLYLKYGADVTTNEQTEEGLESESEE